MPVQNHLSSGQCAQNSLRMALTFAGFKQRASLDSQAAVCSGVKGVQLNITHLAAV